MKDKVLIIGLDGATFRLIMPWIKEGKLPAMARLIQEGVHGDLESTPDMMSPAAWTSFSTGKNPAKHGIYNFMDLIPGTFKFRYYNSSDRDGDTIWSILNRSGKITGVLNVPMTYPADKVNGFMISGWNAPTINSEGFSYPPELVKNLVDKFGDYPLFPTVKKHIAENRPDLAVADLNNHIEITGEATKHLMKENPWDFFVSVFITTDQVQHYFWHHMDKEHPEHDPKISDQYKDVIYDIYSRCDAIIGEVMDIVSDDTTVIVMSDHGFGKNYTANMYLPQWLEKMGLTCKTDEKEVTFLKRPVILARNVSGQILKKLYNFLNTRLGIKAKGYLNTLFPGIRDRVESAWRFAGYDWSRSKAYFCYEPRINLRGREPHGIVNPGKEYDELRDYMIRKLYECRDVKTGEKVVEKIFKGEDVFHGRFAVHAPDIVIWWRDCVVSGLVCTRDDGVEIRATEKVAEDSRTGNHMPYGIFIAKGKHVQKGKRIEGASIMDIAPTVLHLMGESVPSDMDGKVLTDVFMEEFLRTNPVRVLDSQEGTNEKKGAYSSDDEKLVEEHLKALGYLE